MRRKHKVAAELESVLLNLSKTPFQQTLANALAAQPSLEALANFAKKHPDKWASVVEKFAKLAGYTSETKEINLNILARIQNMPDSEIQKQLDNLEEGKLIEDADYVEIKD